MIVKHISEMKEITKGLMPIDEIGEMWKCLTTGERIFLRENTKYVEFKKNGLIYKEGDNPEYLYCLVSGKVKIFKNGIGGRPQIIRLVREGETFAYRAYFSEHEYLTSAAAVEQSGCYQVPLRVIRQIVELNNKFALVFIKFLSNDLGLMDARVVSLTQKHIRGRLAETLVMLLDIYGVDPETNDLCGTLSREDLACFANMTASNAIRTLSSFDSEGLIRINGKRITILDEAKLRKVSANG